MARNLSFPDAKDLEGRKPGEKRPDVQSRDFFWDSLTLFLMGAILTLAVIDVVFEWIRESRIQCFFNQSAATSGQSLIIIGQYVNEKCAARLFPTEYLPAFIALHSLLVLSPHYIWLNTYSSKLDSFFHLASKLSRSREPSTGDYPENNYVISQQLEPSFNVLYRSNWMFFMYLAKLVSQILLALIGLGLVASIFTDFDNTFPCPGGNGTDWISDDWPLPGENAWCVFNTIHLFRNIRIAYFVLLSIAIVCLVLAFVWLVKIHPWELGHDRVVNFSFQTSLPFYYYKPSLGRYTRLSPLFHQFLTRLPICFCCGPNNKSYQIQSDHDFLLVMLFRTDRGLARVLRETHLLCKLREKNNLELAKVTTIRIVNNNYKDLSFFQKRDMLDGKFLNDEDLAWNDIDYGNAHTQVKTGEALVLPNTIRGVVLGLASRSPGRPEDITRADSPQILCGALCIAFDSESLGIAGALARTFRRVAVLNFSKYYSDYKNPVKIDVNFHQSLLLSLTVPHDIIMTDAKTDPQQNIESEIQQSESASSIFDKDYADEIWMPGFISHNRRDKIRRARGEKEGNNSVRELMKTQYPSDYIVVGPITSRLQIATVNMFLRSKLQFLSDKALLLTIKPEKISGVEVDSEEFLTFQPFGFDKLDHTAQPPVSGTLNWPPKSLPQPPDGLRKTHCNTWELKAGDGEDSMCQFSFGLYQLKDNVYRRHGGGGASVNKQQQQPPPPSQQPQLPPPEAARASPNPLVVVSQHPTDTGSDITE